jgi:predicted RNase H-like nuclease (RuvC/YqgF family)
MVHRTRDYIIIQSNNRLNKDKMEELWKLVQDKERTIESQRDEIDRLKAEVFQLRDEKEELMKKMANLTLHDR